MLPKMIIIRIFLNFITNQQTVQAHNSLLFALSKKNKIGMENARYIFPTKRVAFKPGPTLDQFATLLSVC